jgi:preprotein translocase subunit Sec61beta
VETRAIATRKAIRTPRAAAIAGIFFAVLIGAAQILVKVAIPDDSNESGDWVSDDTRRRAVVIALNLLPFAGIAFLWFVGVVRDRIGDNEDRFFATVFLGSGLLFVAMLFASGAVAGGLLVGPDSGSVAPSNAVWSYGRRVTGSLLSVYAMRMAAVFMISTTTLTVRLQLLPRWIVLFGFIGAGVMLVATGWIPAVDLVFPLWVLILSIHILVVSLRNPPVADGDAIIATT